MNATERLLAADSELSPLATPFPLPLGPTAPVVAGAFRGMANGDWVFSGPRGRIGAALRGCAPSRIAEAYAGARPYKLAPSSAAPGNRALHAIGAALATQKPVLCLLGLASAASGAFHEALNVGALTGAPVVFVVVQQHITESAPIGRQLAADPTALAAAFGWSVASVPPTEDAVADAVSAARASGRPSLVSVFLPRR